MPALNELLPARFKIHSTPAHSSVDQRYDEGSSAGSNLRSSHFFHRNMSLSCPSHANALPLTCRNKIRASTSKINVPFLPIHMLNRINV